MAIDALDGSVAVGLGAVRQLVFLHELTFRLTVGVEDSTDDPQEHAHQCKTDSERPSSTESLDTEEDENGRGDDLDDSVDTRSQQRGGRTGDTDTLEDIWRIVIDRAWISKVHQGWTHFCPDHCWKVKTAKAMKNLILFPGMKASFQDRPPTADSSSATATTISSNSARVAG